METAVPVHVSYSRILYVKTIMELFLLPNVSSKGKLFSLLKAYTKWPVKIKCLSYLI